MSHISQVKSNLRDQESIIQALVDQGFKLEEIEIHKTAADLVDGGGKAEIIVRKAAIQRATGRYPYTDMGFRKQADGNYQILIDEYTFKTDWTNTLTQRYNRALDLKRAKVAGWVATETKLENGAIKLTLRR